MSASNNTDRISLDPTGVVGIKVGDMCLTLEPNCSPQSGDDN